MSEVFQDDTNSDAVTQIQLKGTKGALDVGLSGKCVALCVSGCADKIVCFVIV